MSDLARTMYLMMAVIFLTACQHLPATPHLPKSLELTERSNLPQPKPSQLSTIMDTHQKKGGLSGYYPIATGANAFASRSILSDMASHSIDVQYYIWHDDEAGMLMLNDLWEAAERGVVVRLLLDDFNGSPTLDKKLSLFASHPNIAVRLVNPFSQRRLKTVSFLASPAVLNTRMHNKSMTFDKHVSIIGGRNIGNEYLNNDKNNHFADLDVLLIGSVVSQINDSFEEYWQSPQAYDIQTLVPAQHTPTKKTLGLIRHDRHAKNQATPDQQALHTYRTALNTSTIGQDLLAKKIPFRWANIEFLADDAYKLSKKNLKQGHLVHKLRKRLGRPKKNLSIISSYFVPTKDGVHTLATLAKSGVKVSILTNSFYATDVGAVHSGYAHWRIPLLKSGVKLYELKATAMHHDDDNKLWRNKHTTTTSLHAKAFAVDDNKVFIGSYNIDPRSANINTELGVLIYDHTLAQQLHHALNNDNNTPSNTLLHQAYEVSLANGKLQWRTIEQGQEVIFEKEPHLNTPEKIGITLMSWLPIDWLL